jgi:DNA-binding response OmpR family regulator
MGEQTILLIERQTSTASTFATPLERKGYELVVVPTGSRALEQAGEIDPVLMILNAASLGSSGVRICSRLHDEVGVPIIHIVEEDMSPPPDHMCHVFLKLPFTARKLVNRIKRLLPSNREHSIQVGSVELLPAVRVVKVPEKETRLTPKATSLLEVFLNHPDETLDRGYLMRQVWDTNYVGDTRTLDVHIRWIRQAIEPEPGSPHLIRTIRGVGYRFEPGGLDERGKEDASD